MAITSVFPTQGFQNFIDESINVLSATPGTPGIGQFRSTVVGRAPITDIANNLKPSFGIERIQTQLVYQSQNEFGPNGEPVWSVANDDRGLIRFVGTWSPGTATYGIRPISNFLNDYVEVTFYGTALNVLVTIFASNQDFRVTVDGGTESSNICPASTSAVIDGRGYASNHCIVAASGLALGIHTVKIRNNNVASGDLQVYGFEVINASTNIATNPGSAFAQGRRSALTTQDAQSPTSGFTNVSGTVGTKGGHVLQYLASDGTIKKDIQYVDVSSNFLTSADHTNEEVARSFNFREFGAGRADDFSRITGATNAAYTLDDGVTTLVGTNIVQSTATSYDGLRFGATVGDFATLTFIGTGLDIMRQDDSATGSDTYAVNVDGASIGNLNTTASLLLRKEKIVSGLPYGTHTVRITRNTNATFRLNIQQFIVYQPKKPALPTGAVELADYNVVATYVATTGTQGPDTISSGVIRKMATREFTYVGTWGGGATLTTTDTGGWLVRSTTNGDSFSYTFFGTGFELGARTGVAPCNMTVTIDGTLYTGAATSLNGTSGTAIGSWTPGTGTYAADSGYGAKLQVTGLTLGLHTVKFTGTSITGNIGVASFDIITPIYSAKSNLNYDQQNTLPIGSNALSDNRKTSPLKDPSASKKNISQAFGVTSGGSTSSAIQVPMPDMSVTHLNTTGRIRVSWMAQAYNGTVNQIVNYQLVIDGLLVGPTQYAVTYSGASGGVAQNNILEFNVSPGIHKIDLTWSCGGSGTANAVGTSRSLLVEEA
jgi:hypothetical protein